MVDPATGQARRALAADIARIARLVDQLPRVGGAATGRRPSTQGRRWV
jgi:hypothetical protein